VKIFELVFYLLIFLSVLTIVAIIRAFSSGRHRRTGWALLRTWLVLAGFYAAILISTSLALSIRVLPVGEAQYSGDWSISVESLRRMPHDLDEDYFVDFQLYDKSNAALRGPNGLVVYLLDENGTRYNPAPSPESPGFDVLIQPWKKITTTRKFVLPTNLNRVEVVIVREGFRRDWFIIGRSPFDGHTVVQLQ